MGPEADFAQFIHAIDASVPGGTVSILSVVVCGLVGFYRRDWFQSLLPERMRWDNWPRMQKWAFSFTTGLACGALTNIAAGKGPVMSVALGVGAGLGAMGLRETQKAVMPPTTTIYVSEPNLGARQAPME